MKYNQTSNSEEFQVDTSCDAFINNAKVSRVSTMKSFSANRHLLILVICMFMISTSFAERFGPERILQAANPIEDETFKTRVNCPWSFYNRSIELVNARTDINQAQKDNILDMQHYSTTTMSKHNNHPQYNASRLYVLQVKSLITAYTEVNGTNSTKKVLNYCGLSRSFYRTCQEDAKYTCSSPAAMFDTTRYEHIDVAFINLINPRIIPNPFEVGNLGIIPLCMDMTKEQHHCTMYEKKTPLTTYSDPLSIHHQGGDTAHVQTTGGPPKEKDSLIHIRIMPDNWPLSPHIHGLQIRPTMDGHPESWVSNSGLRGAGAFSSEDECVYNAFDSRDAYTTHSEPGDGNAPPPLIIRDRKGFDVTYLAKVNRYPNAQNPGTLWYHDHAMRLTNYNAISGLAGFYLIRNPVVEAEINVPRENQIFFIVSQSINWKTIAPNKFRGGQVYRFRFLSDLPDSHHKIWFTHGNCTNTTIASRIPFTLIGTDGSLFHQGISGMHEFHIGSGQRIQLLIKTNDNFNTFELCAQQLQHYWLLRDPPATHNPYITLQEQLDANYTFNYPFNASRLHNVTIPQAPARPPASPYTGRTSIDNVVLSVSYQDLKLMPDSEIKTKKMRPLNFQYHGQLFTLHGRSDFHKGFTQYSEVGSTQDYYFINLSNTPHPMHFHLVNFQVTKTFELRTYMVQNSPEFGYLGNCTYYQVDFLTEAIKLMVRSESTIHRFVKYHLKRIYRNNFQIINIDYLCRQRAFLFQNEQVKKYVDLVYPQNGPADPVTKVHGLDLMRTATATDVLNGQSIYNVTLGGLKYVTDSGTTRLRPEHERWRDTVMVGGRRASIFRVRWTKNDYNATLVPKDTYFNIPLDQLRQYPGFVYHCHIIHHEDFEMMRGFMMTIPQDLDPSQALDRNTPCNYNATTRRYAIDWADKAKCINQRCQAWAATQTANS